MNSNASGRVLHLVPANGGGVDRFVRDLCSLRPSDWLLHVSDEQCVVESPDEGLFVPVASADLDRLVAQGAVGHPSALHAHSTVRSVREATRTLARGLELRWVLTLHDVQSAGQDASLDPRELGQRIEFIRESAHRTLPTAFMRAVAAQVVGQSVHCTLLENGADPLPAAGPGASTRTDRTFPVAVIGALGQHKGLAHLIQVARQLPADVRIVLLGYADGQLGPGWLVPDRIWVHGVFEPAELPGLVAAYGAKMAFFPCGQPESYCYALSDAWLAGLCAIGPDHGAIGERLRAHGGGMPYAVDASPVEVARIIASQLQQTEACAAGVAAAVRALVSVASMVEQLNELYAGIGGPETAADLDALKQTAAKHLDSRFFRQELLRLGGDLAAATQQRDGALDELRSLAADFTQRGAWIEHMQQGNDSLRKVCGEMQRSVEELQMARAADQEQLRALQSEHAALQEAHRALTESYGNLARRLTWPLRLLPASWRNWIKKAARRLLVGGEKHG